MSLVLHMLFHMSLYSISHPLLCNTHFFQCFIYVYFCTNRSLRGYSNILRDWKLNFCEVAGEEQEIAGRRWLWQAQGQEWGENSLGFAPFFFSYPTCFSLHFLAALSHAQHDHQQQLIGEAQYLLQHLCITIWHLKKYCCSCFYGWKYMSFDMRKPATRASKRGKVIM